jgi:hypothetical protein
LPTILSSCSCGQSHILIPRKLSLFPNYLSVFLERLKNKDP